MNVAEMIKNAAAAAPAGERAGKPTRTVRTLDKDQPATADHAVTITSEPGSVVVSFLSLTTPVRKVWTFTIGAAGITGATRERVGGSAPFAARPATQDDYKVWDRSTIKQFGPALRAQFEAAIKAATPAPAGKGK